MSRTRRHFGARLTLCSLDNRELPAVGFSALGSEFGSLPTVNVTRPDGSPLATINAYDPAFRGGVHAVTGELDGNAATVEVITGAGRSGGPHVRVFSVDTANGATTVLTEFFAFDPRFAGGITVEAADLNGKGAEEIVVAAGPGGGPHVRSFEIIGNGAVQCEGACGSFFAFDPQFAGGVNLGAGNLDGDLANGEELIVGAGPGGGPHVRAFNDAGTFSEFFAFDPTDTGGVAFAAVTTPGLLTVGGGGVGVKNFTFNEDGSFTATFLRGGTRGSIAWGDYADSFGRHYYGDRYDYDRSRLVVTTTLSTVPFINPFPGASFAGASAPVNSLFTVLPFNTFFGVSPVFGFRLF